jgi:hypothetical protein
MRKLILTCHCGQKMKLPRSSIGKKGLCPGCGSEVDISASEARPENRSSAPKFSGTNLPQQHAQAGAQDFSLMDAKQAFGRATDLFFEHRYGEALSLFDSIALKFPGSPEIEDARRQCLAAMRRPNLALPPAGAVAAPSLALPAPQDKETVKNAVIHKLMEKMQGGASDEIQLRAAELIGQMMGLFEGQGNQSANEEEDAAAAEDVYDGVEDSPIPSNVEQMPRREQG